MNLQLFKRIHRFLWKIKIIILEYYYRIKYRDMLKKNEGFKDCHQNDLCFVIGNGPSLTVNDLESIRKTGKISFAANRVYNLFNSTSWRPYYYLVCDRQVYLEEFNDINKVDAVKFFPLDLGRIKWIQSANYYSRIPFQFLRKKPGFSHNIVKGLEEGGSVVFHMIQLATYMGFKKICIVGVDFSFSWGIDVNGNYFENPAIKDHFEGGGKTNTMPNLQYNHWAFESAKKYADKNNIEIIDYTRGGKLDVFEKGDLDKLFFSLNVN